MCELVRGAGLQFGRLAMIRMAAQMVGNGKLSRTGVRATCHACEQTRPAT